MTREEAIKILTEIQTQHKKYIGQTECNNALNMAIEALQAEPIKRGTWQYYVKGNDKWAVCSECGIVSIVGGNYCPNCGAKMKGGVDK